MKKGYMKQSEIAELLGVSRPTVNRFLRDHGIAADLIDGQTQLYKNDTVLDIVDRFQGVKRPVQNDNEQAEHVEANDLNRSVEQVKDWELIANIYKEQLENTTEALNKALDSLSKEQETKQQLLLQFEQERTKKGFLSWLFKR